jgi:Na+-translocating ferredoxin:NAD+ oxidoreductase RnfC subunit
LTIRVYQRRSDDGLAYYLLETPVTKTTGGLLVLPGNHPLIQRRRQDERTLLAIARTVCEQCRLCTDLCPRHLIGHELSLICWCGR